MLTEAKEAILQLPRQSAQTLLRYSTAQTLRHLPHTIDPTGLVGKWQRIDWLHLNDGASLDGFSGRTKY